MKVHQGLAIVLGLMGAACDGETGATGETGAQGATGAQGPAGATGPAGPQGAAGDSRVTLESETCDAVSGNFTCSVTCTGVGAIAIANAGWSATPDQGNTLYLNDHGQDADDPATWNFDYGTEGVTVGTPITISVVCFTPPAG